MSAAGQRLDAGSSILWLSRCLVAKALPGQPPVALCPSSLQQPHWQHACPASPPPPQKLYFCEYDLQFFRHRHQMLRHLKKVKLLHPPGTEIYRNGNISMFEVGASLQV